MKLHLVATIKKAAPEWKTYVKGEYWIFDNGTSIYCDGEVVDENHVTVAKRFIADHYSYKAQVTLYEFFGLDENGNDLLEGQINLTDAEEELLNRREQYLDVWDVRDNEEDIVELMVTGNYPADEREFMGADVDLWRDDVRILLEKNFGAIQVIENSFACWTFTKKIIENIQDFLNEMEFPPNCPLNLEETNPKHQYFPRISTEQFAALSTVEELYAL